MKGSVGSLRGRLHNPYLSSLSSVVFFRKGSEAAEAAFPPSSKTSSLLSQLILRDREIETPFCLKRISPAGKLVRADFFDRLGRSAMR